MGNPQNFSVDVPRRCHVLLEQLWPTVSDKVQGQSLPLNASFLLAISTPMVNLPIERIWKPQNGRAVGHINDSVLDAALAQVIKKDIGSTAVAHAPFYESTAWRYHYLPKGAAFPNLSQKGLPAATHAALGAEKAVKDADALTTIEFCSILRNGLAHGGVLYLDRHGQATEGTPVQMFCFVSEKRIKNISAGLHFLRVGMKDYRAFLAKWTGWLGNAATPKTANDPVVKSLSRRSR